MRDDWQYTEEAITPEGRETLLAPTRWKRAREILNAPNLVLPGPDGNDWWVYSERRILDALGGDGNGDCGVSTEQSPPSAGGGLLGEEQ